MRRRPTPLVGVALAQAAALLVAATNSAPADGPSAAAARPAPPAAKLQVRLAELPLGTRPPFDPAASAWEHALPTRILVNRTPRIYQTEPNEQPPLPSVEVRGLRVGSKLLLRLRWSDATRNAPVAPPARTGEAGVPAQIYKRPTAETSTFADAAAVMVPDRWTGPGFPSLVMGDQHAPALLYYWDASRGTELLKAAGRATTTRTGTSVPHQARHADGYWTVTLELPGQPNGYPIAFAFWDGQGGDRDGRKFFSVWYVLTRSVGGTAAAPGEAAR